MNRIEAIIAGTKIPLKVTEEEEPYVRKAIEDANARIKQYQTEYLQKDIQDCIIMALLAYAVEYHKALERTIGESSLQTLEDIRDQLRVMGARAEE
jgi:GTPase SAR1 family protein